MSNAVPSGWRLLTIDDFAKTSAGGTPNTQVPEYWENGSIPWMSSGEVHKKRVKSVNQSITELGFQNSSAKLFPVATILIALAGQGKTRGTVAISEIELTTNQSIAGVIVKDSAIHPDYVYQNLDSRYEELRAASGGSGRAGLNLAIIGEQQLMLPPLPEQQKIAAILSSVDDVIEKTRAQIDKLKDLKTGMMQELLTKGIGADGVPHTEFKDSPVGRIPAYWEVRKADDISDAIMVGVVIKPTQYYVDQGVPALRSANVRENGLTMENLKYFSEESNDLLHKSKLSKGDLLTVRTGYPGTTAVVTKEFEGCNCIDVVITRPSAEIDSDFFCLWVNSDHGKGQVLKAQGGLAQQHFNVGDMKNLLVPVPPLEEQRDIFRATDSVIRKLSTSEKRLARLNSLKKALMQDLLTGKVRVNVDQKEAVVA